MRFLTRIKIKLSPTISLLLFSLNPRSPRKINAVIREVIEPLGLISPR